MSQFAQIIWTAIIAALLVLAAVIMVYPPEKGANDPLVTVSPAYEPDPADWDAYVSVEDTIHIIPREAIMDD